ncbi:MAG TPA: hypothetical protein VFU06_14430 [Longimicrobiales bacterium]|nr:hypothetical protein [Longimicrobiales bacterium]
MMEVHQASLRALCRMSAEELESAEAESVRRDCADALRLELDCRQLELGVSEREVLAHLSDLLEASSYDGVALAAAVRAAAGMLGAATPDRTI